MEYDKIIINNLVKEITKTKKYKNICEELIFKIGTIELEKKHRLKEAIKTTKKKLHQIGAVYQKKIDYKYWVTELNQTFTLNNICETKKLCKNIMFYQSSTRERLDIIKDFYSIIFKDLSGIKSILDIGCGLNPLSIFWIPFYENITYYGYDIYKDMIDFLNSFMKLYNINGYAKVQNIISNIPTEKVDITLLLKTLPCFEQLEKNISLKLLESINTKHLIVSFPTKSIGGKVKGMLVNYNKVFSKLIENKNYLIKQFEFPNELVFRLTKY